MKKTWLSNTSCVFPRTDTYRLGWTWFLHLGVVCKRVMTDGVTHEDVVQWFRVQQKQNGTWYRPPRDTVRKTGCLWPHAIDDYYPTPIGQIRSEPRKIQFKSLMSKTCSSRWRRISWSIVSKAVERSKRVSELTPYLHPEPARGCSRHSVKLFFCTVVRTIGKLSRA